MAGFYSFIRGISGKLGVGVADQGFVHSSTLPNNSGIGPERMVQRCFVTGNPNFAILRQNVPINSPLGTTGSNLHGVALLARLANKGGK